MCSIRSTRLWPVCDGVGVLRRHADQSGVSRMRSGLRRSARLSSRCTHLHCQEADLWESTPGEDSRMSRSPSDARCFPLERPDGHSVSTLVSVLRRDLPLLPDSEQRGVKPPPEREADLSTLMAPRSYPSVDARWHGIVQRRQRTLTSVRRIQTSEFGTVSFSRSLYSYVYVDLPQLPMFLDPPWLLLSYHSSRLDPPVVSVRSVFLPVVSVRSVIYIFCLVGHLPLRTTSSTVVHFKNFLPALSPWQSSAHYYDCSVPFTPARDLSVWDRSFRQLTTLLYCWSHGIFGGLPHGGPTSSSISWGSVFILSSAYPLRPPFIA